MLKLLRELYLIPLYIYRGIFSPFSGPCCRYTPSCSVYMMKAVRKFGIIKGTILGVMRISRCRKGYLGGPDPIPEVWDWNEIKTTYTSYKIKAQSSEQTKT